ncbi:MAG: MFS transporter [Sphingomonadales bacterium 32-68-7]|nr:MAG: MFS transporter [Sphingomonadales bacterium 12-68-11]OYX09576.1 MAG: MFS transporter [Sphingomonadales bacterium 32-68-7]
MAIAPTSPAGSAGPAPDSGQPWPSEKAGFYALFCIIFATFLNFFDLAIFNMLAERMKASFEISDTMLGFVQGPASVIAYVIVGIPLARLVDLYPRKFVLSGGIALIGTITALGGLAQSFGQFVGSRLFVGASGAANGPGSYSLLVDFFRPLRIPLVFALLQLGYVLGQTAGTWGGGYLLAWTDTWPETSEFLGLTIFSWQWIMVMAGAPGLLAAVLFLFVREPARRGGPAAAAQAPAGTSFGRKLATAMGWDAAKAIWQRKRVFLPLFAALALSAIESQGLPAWRVPFIARTFGWNELEISRLMGPLLLVAMLAGITFGGLFVSWLGKRYKDANIRATAIIFACTATVTIAAPLMPSAELAIGCMVLGVFFGMAGAPAQNAAIQRIAPNAMRGQVTALYLFMFTFFGAMGSFVIGFVSDYVVGDPQQVWKALLITAVAFLPVATFFMWRGIRPYREEVERIEAESR